MDRFADGVAAELMELIGARDQVQAARDKALREEAIRWREAVFTGTSSDLMLWINKRWEELGLSQPSGQPAEGERIKNDNKR